MLNKNKPFYVYHKLILIAIKPDFKFIFVPFHYEFISDNSDINQT